MATGAGARLYGRVRLGGWKPPPRVGRRFARMGEGRWTGGGGTADASQRRRYAGGEGENTQCRTPNVQFPREERRGGWRPGRVRDCMDGFGWAVGNRRHGWGGGLRGWGRGVGWAEVELPTPCRGAATQGGEGADDRDPSFAQSYGGQAGHATLLLLGRGKHLFILAGDDAGTGFVDEVGPAPLEEDGEFVAEADEEEEVDEEPGGPGEHAAHLEAAGLGDGAVFSDDGHDAFVTVAEGGPEFGFATGVAGGGKALVFAEDGGDVAAHLGGGGSEAGDGFSVGAGDGNDVAGGEEVGMAGDGEIGGDEEAAAAIAFAGEAGGEIGGLHAGGPDDGGGFDPTAGVEVDAAAFDLIDAGFEADFDAEVLEAVPGIVGEVGLEGLEDAIAGLDEEDAEVGRVDAAEVGLEGAADEIGEGSGEFHAGGAAADDDDGHEAAAFVGIGGAFGAFEAGEDAAADGLGVLEGFEPDGVGGPFVFAEEGGVGAGGEDEGVEGVGVFGGAGRVGVAVDGGDVVEEDGDICGGGEDAAEGAGDVGGGEGGGGDLVEEGLEEVVVAPVDEGDGETGVIGEFLGAGEARESAADDENLPGTGHGPG